MTLLKEIHSISVSEGLMTGIKKFINYSVLNKLSPVRLNNSKDSIFISFDTDETKEVIYAKVAAANKAKVTDITPKDVEKFIMTLVKKYGENAETVKLSKRKDKIEWFNKNWGGYFGSFHKGVTLSTEGSNNGGRVIISIKDDVSKEQAEKIANWLLDTFLLVE